MSPPVSHRVALCGEFSTEVGKTPTERLKRPVWACFAQRKNWRFAQESTDLRGSIKKQEKESVPQSCPTRLTSVGNADRIRLFDGFMQFAIRRLI